MPAPQQYAPTSLSTRITDWLRDHPGFHRPAAIAAGLGVPEHLQPEEGKKPPRARWTMRVGQECLRMFNRGQLVRQQAGKLRTAGGVRAATYSLPEETPDT